MVILGTVHNYFNLFIFFTTRTDKYLVSSNDFIGDLMNKIQAAYKFGKIIKKGKQKIKDHITYKRRFILVQWNCYLLILSEQ